MKIRIGLLRLTDAAPVILAKARGLFAQAGLEVALSVEPSWSNIADKLAYGLLEAAVMLPPLAIACALGLRGRRTELIVPMTLSLNGNSVTLAPGWAEAEESPHDAAQAGAAFRTAIAARGARPVLAVVHGFSTHDLLLRHRLAASEIDPERQVRFTVLPPAEMLGSLAAGAIDGFCAGAPWGLAAARAGLGVQAVHSAAIRPDHAEKCLAVRADWAAGDPAGLRVLRACITAAATLCADPEEREGLTELLASPDHLALPPALIAASLAPEAGGPVFTPPQATTPDPDDARWFAREMARWGHTPPGIEEEAAALYRPAG